MKAAARAAGVDSWRTIQWPTARAETWTRTLARDPSILALVAIGSAARGCARAASDLDLVVVHRATSRPAVLPPPEVDVRWIREDQVESAVADGDDVIAWAIAFGVVLHDPAGSWRETVARWQDEVPLPSPTVCHNRASRAQEYAVALSAAGDEDAAREQLLTMLTHRARGRLSAMRIRPLSRPELPQQLRSVEQKKLAALLECAMTDGASAAELLVAADAEERGDAARTD